MPFSALFNRALIGAFLLAFVSNVPLGLVESIWALFIADKGGSDLMVGVSFSTIAIARMALLPWGGLRCTAPLSLVQMTSVRLASPSRSMAAMISPVLQSISSTLSP